MTRIYFLVPGILNFPNNSRNWNDWGVTHIHTALEYQQAGAKAEDIAYFCGIIGRAFGQQKRCRKFLEHSNEYPAAQFRRYVIAHSNGNAVVQQALLDQPKFDRIEELHLVCAASDPNFTTNGLNTALASGQIGHIYVYIAGKDRALNEASTFIGRMLGYGNLGKVGPKYVSMAFEDRVTVIEDGPWKDYGHSDCWADANFARTMNGFLK